MAISRVARAARRRTAVCAAELMFALAQTGIDSLTSNHCELPVDHVLRFAEGCEYLRVIGDAHRVDPFSKGMPGDLNCVQPPF